MFPLNEIIRYEPLLSDVSDDELRNTVEVLEKSENIVALSSINVMKATRSGRHVIGWPKVSEIYKFNPIRSKEAMTELGKKRWVSLWHIYDSKLVAQYFTLTDIHRNFFVTQMV